MMSPRLVLVLAVVGLTASVSATCWPRYSTTSITPLRQYQVQQVLDDADFIKSLEADPDLLLNAENQRSIVTLTAVQRIEVMRKYPIIFTSEPPTALGDISVPETDCPPTAPGREGCTAGCVFDEETGECRPATGCVLSIDSQTCLSPRRIRQTMGHTRVCPGVNNDSPLILVRRPNGQVVELVQMPGQNNNQWILEEQCQIPMDNGMTCGLAERSVRALFINLSGIVSNNGGSGLQFDFAEVIVHFCVVVVMP